MQNPPSRSGSEYKSNRVTQEYQVLHKVAQILQAPAELEDMLGAAMKAITAFEELRVEAKAGIFLADKKNKILRLLTTYGEFSQEFLDKEKEVPFGDCLCGRAAVSGEILMSESCFEDSRHERTFSDMTAHGHYIVPLKSGDHLVGIMFLYTNTHPSWYRNSQEVLLSIGGLIAGAIERKQIEEEIHRYRNQLEERVALRTMELTKSTENLESEIEDHERTHKQLINLSREIQTIQEEEKARIAREVHDELGQSLTALKMELLHLNKKLSDPALAENLRSMVQLVDTTITAVQKIAMDLRPPILDAFGLKEAIAWQAGEYEKRFGLTINVLGLGDIPNLDNHLKTALFRIFQETITNVIRHAEATKAHIELNADGNYLLMKIFDDGKGIEEKAITDSHSIGLIGMRERVRPWKGEVCFFGQPGKGTCVEVKIPVKKL
jgi:signal transduction histidine kinase